MKSFNVAVRVPALLWIACAGLVPAVAGATVQVIDTPQFQIRYHDASARLYGTPVSFGDSLTWFPSGSRGFEAATTRGIDPTASSFSLQVQMKPGFLLEGVRMEVEGDWLAFGRAAVTAIGLLRLTPLHGPAERGTEVFLSRSGASTSDRVDFTPWHGSIDLSLDRAASFANVTLQNLLLARGLPRRQESTDSTDLFNRPTPNGDAGLPDGYAAPDTLWRGHGNSFAYVDVKLVSLQFVVSAIPEPAGWALMLAGLGVVAAVGRGRRRAAETAPVRTQADGC